MGVAWVTLVLVLLLSVNGSRKQQAFSDGAQLHAVRASPPASVTPADQVPHCRLFRPPKRAPWVFNIAIVGAHACAVK